MPVHYPEAKLENAVKSIYEASNAISISNTYTCWNADNPDLPALTFIVAESEAQLGQNGPTGNWTCQLEISAISHIGDEDGETHIGYEGEMRDECFYDDVMQRINQAAQTLGEPITIMIWKPTKFARTIDEGRRVSTQTVEVFLAPSSVS